MKPTSNWTYNTQRDMYVEQATGFTSTLEAPLGSKSRAGIQVPTMSAALMRQQTAAQQTAAMQRQLLHNQTFGGIEHHAGAVSVVPMADDIAWLRKRVDEMLWRAA